MATTDGENRGRKSDIAASDFRQKGVRGRVAVTRVAVTTVKTIGGHSNSTMFAKLGCSQSKLFT